MHKRFWTESISPDLFIDICYIFHQKHKAFFESTPFYNSFNYNLNHMCQKRYDITLFFIYLLALLKLYFRPRPQCKSVWKEVSSRSISYIRYLPPPCCVHMQETVISPCYCVASRNQQFRPDMTENVLPWTQTHNHSPRIILSTCIRQLAIGPKYSFCVMPPMCCT